jgi:hypothetical protein
MGEGFPYLGEEFPHMGEGFPYLGEEFPHLGKGFPHIGEDIPGLGEEFPGLGREFTNFGESSPRSMGDKNREKIQGQADFVALILRSAISGSLPISPGHRLPSLPLS